MRLLAIDCDARELCFIVASATGERVTLEDAATVPLKNVAEDRPLTIDEIGKQLQAVLSKQKKSGVKILTAVDRNAIELSEFTLPPSADAELPELVLNQLSMDSPNIADEAVIDFLTSPGSANDPRRITAAALARVEFNRVKDICNVAGLTLDRMLVRPYETASLFLQQRSQVSGNSLLVNVITDEVDLVVVDQSRPLFFRTVRLPSSLGDEAAEQRLLDEIRRTLLVAPQNAEVGQVIESVYFLGSGPDYERLAQQISKDGTTKVEVLDPYAGFSLGPNWERPTSGRLVPLLGMLAAEARGAKHSIDFLNPRRAPKPPNRRRQLVLATLALVSLVGTGGYFISDAFAEADKETKRLREELSELDALVKKTAEKRKITEAVEDWNSNGVVWLDELRDLSTKFPPGQDIVIQRLAMTPSRGGKANISFLGLARESKVVPRMEASLRDSRHEIQTPRVEERVQDKFYSWSFDSAISLTPPKWEVEEPAEEEPVARSERSSSKKKAATSSKNKKKPAKAATKKALAEDKPEIKEEPLRTPDAAPVEPEKAVTGDSLEEK